MNENNTSSVEPALQTLNPQLAEELKQASPDYTAYITKFLKATKFFENLIRTNHNFSSLPHRFWPLDEKFFEHLIVTIKSNYNHALDLFVKSPLFKFFWPTQKAGKSLGFYLISEDISDSVKDIFFDKFGHSLFEKTWEGKTIHGLAILQALNGNYSNLKYLISKNVMITSAVKEEWNTIQATTKNKEAIEKIQRLLDSIKEKDNSNQKSMNATLNLINTAASDEKNAVVSSSSRTLATLQKIPSLTRRGKLIVSPFVRSDKPETADYESAFSKLEQICKNITPYVTLDYIQLILEYSISDQYINTTSKSFGGTPLHVAAQIGRADIVKLLLHFGADQSIRANVYNLADQQTFVTEYAGLSPIHIAIKRGHEDIVAALIDHPSFLSCDNYPALGLTFKEFALEYGNLKVNLILSAKFPNLFKEDQNHNNDRSNERTSVLEKRKPDTNFENIEILKKKSKDNSDTVDNLRGAIARGLGTLSASPNSPTMYKSSSNNAEKESFVEIDKSNNFER